jgi:cell division protein FtsA
MSKGLVLNLDETRESIRESVRQAELASAVKMESAYVGVTGKHVSSINSRGTITISHSDRLVRSEDLERVLEAARSVTIPSDRKVLHIIPRQYSLDGHPGIKDPVGMHGFKLDVETHIVTAAMASVQNLVKCVREVGLRVDDLILEPLAASEAVLEPDDKESGVILADIGGGTTDVAVFREGSVWHTTVLPVGGYQVTRDIAIGLGIPFDAAEEIKKRYGNVIPSEELKRDLKAESTELRTEEGYSIASRDLCYIISARTEETLRMILAGLPSATEYQAIAPKGLVLIGGTANLPGIEALAQGISGLQVRVGIPRGIYGLTEVLYNPAYATSVGLLLWATKRQLAGYAEGGIKEGNVFTRFFRQVGKLFGRG